MIQHCDLTCLPGACKCVVLLVGFKMCPEKALGEAMFKCSRTITFTILLSKVQEIIKAFFVVEWGRRTYAFEEM